MSLPRSVSPHEKSRLKTLGLKDGVTANSRHPLEEGHPSILIKKEAISARTYASLSE
jgi:hypothetical protein